MEREIDPPVIQAKMSKATKIGFNWHISPHRTYYSGRPLRGHCHGERIRSISEVKSGDLIIEVNHQVKTENPLFVKSVEEGSFSAHFAFTGEYSPYTKYPSDFNSNLVEFYFAKPLELEPLVKQLLEQLSNIHDGNDDQGGVRYAGTVDQWLIQTLAEKVEIDT